MFAEYGNDWDQYWALRLFDTKTKQEKTLFVDDTKMSGYEWLSDKTIRAFQNTGTGIRGYRDINVEQKEPLFYKEYKYQEPSTFWTPDEKYAEEVKEAQEAQNFYYEKGR